MGAFFKNGEQYGGTATTASQVMYNTTESVADKIDELEGKTGEDIPVNTATPNTSVNSAINACFGRTASDIPYSQGVSVADKLDTIEDDITPFKSLKTYEHSSYLTVNASTIATFDITVPKSDYRLVVGIGITSNENVLPMQYYLSTATNLHLRVRNLSSQAQQFSFFVNYI